jgi:hypothetical protein
VILEETRIVHQLLGDESPPISAAYHTETSILLTWRGGDDRLNVEITIDGIAHWRYHNLRSGETWELDHDIEEGWPAEGKRMLMRFNRRRAA